jgi:hypothetical protein
MCMQGKRRAGSTREAEMIIQVMKKKIMSANGSIRGSIEIAGEGKGVDIQQTLLKALQSQSPFLILHQRVHQRQILIPPQT